MTTLLLEIGDKIVPVSIMYAGFLLLGSIGAGVGYWRWKLGIVWILFPLSLMVVAFLSLQTEEIGSLYPHIIRELGQAYIWHSWLSPIAGGLMAVIGTVGGFLRRKRQLALN